MIYFYKSISPQPIENLHKYLHHFFTQLFAEVSSVYDHTHHIELDFKDIVTKYNQIDNALSDMFTAYSGLKKGEKIIVQKAYYNNNDIVGICNNIKKPFKYSELPFTIQTPIKNLYDSNGILYKMLTDKKSYKKIKDKCGNLKTHFEEFRKANKYSICPFCGMENLLTEYEKGKNEYDHYISKGLYPFCSINFDNLAPICDYCNKAENKGSKDIPFIPKSNPQKQGRLFYPYCNSIANHEIYLEIKSFSTDLSNPAKWTLNITCKPSKNSPLKERWMEIYNIETRYKGKIIKDSYDWKLRIINKYRLRCKKNGDSFQKFKEDILDDFKEYKKWNNGLMMKTFDEFIMNDPNCEANLAGNLVI